MMTTWRILLQRALATNNEQWPDIVACTLSDEQLDVPFGFGDVDAAAFTLWTARSVYFPVVYDGAESVGRVSRHPDGAPTEHVGGWRYGAGL